MAATSSMNSQPLSGMASWDGALRVAGPAVEGAVIDSGGAATAGARQRARYSGQEPSHTVAESFEDMAGTGPSPS